MTNYQHIFLCSLACESCYSKSGYLCPDWSWVGIRDSQVKLGKSRLNRDAWTVCKGFFGGGGVRGSGGMLPQKKFEIWGLQTAGNALKLLILPSLCYICMILNLLRSHQADLFGSWGMPAHGPEPRFSDVWVGKYQLVLNSILNVTVAHTSYGKTKTILWYQELK